LKLSTSIPWIFVLRLPRRYVYAMLAAISAMFFWTWICTSDKGGCGSSLSFSSWARLPPGCHRHINALYRGLTSFLAVRDNSCAVGFTTGLLRARSGALTRRCGGRKHFSLRILHMRSTWRQVLKNQRQRRRTLLLQKAVNRFFGCSFANLRRCRYSQRKYYRCWRQRWHLCLPSFLYALLYLFAADFAHSLFSRLL